MAKDKFAEIKTPLGNKLLLRSAYGREELGRPFLYRIELLSEDASIKASSVLGQGMTIKLSLEKESEHRYVNGIVSSFSDVGRVGRYALYRAELRPWIWLLSHSSDCRIFQNETIPDILKKVFRDFGFTDLEDGLTDTYRPLEYVVQYRETALNFVTRLMERAGIYYFFTHEEGKHSLVLAESISAHKPAASYEKIPYYPPNEAQARERDHIHDWRLQQQFRTGTYTINDFDFKRPSADLEAKSAAPRDHAKSDFELYDYPGDYTEQSDGETAAKIRLQAQHAQYEQVSSTGNARGINAGHLFSLENFKRSDQNREYLAVAVESTIEIKAHESDSGATVHGSRYQSSIVAIDSKTDFRLPITTRKPVVMGPQTAIVSGKEGEEIWTDEHGRVKLKFHWDRKGKPNEESSCWVRVAQLWAGSGWGSVHIPRVGQEVVVEFLEGDPDRPLVTGSVYNGSNNPPHELPGKAAWSGFKSRSTKGGNPDEGNEIRFSDVKGEEELLVHAQKNYQEVIKQDRTTEVKGKHETVIEGAYTLESRESVELSAPTSITLKCGEMASITMDAKMIEIKFGASIITLDPSGITMLPSVKVGNRPL